MRVRGKPRVNPKEKKKKKTGKGLGKRKIEEKRRNGKEGVREERKIRQTQLKPFLLKK